jgi:hypothetical protein
LFPCLVVDVRLVVLQRRDCTSERLYGLPKVTQPVRVGANYLKSTPLTSLKAFGIDCMTKLSWHVQREMVMGTLTTIFVQTVPPLHRLFPNSSSFFNTPLLYVNVIFLHLPWCPHILVWVWGPFSAPSACAPIPLDCNSQFVFCTLSPLRTGTMSHLSLFPQI